MNATYSSYHPGYRSIWLMLLLLALPVTAALAQRDGKRRDTTKTKLETTNVLPRDSNYRVSVRNIDITKFPLVNIVFDVFDEKNNFVDGLDKADILVSENGKSQSVISMAFITSTNRIPIDFVFLIDQTGSMGSKIDGVKQNIDDFTTRLVAKGIDYRLGLIVFDDNVSKRYWLTDDLREFKKWVEGIHAEGGGDEKENAMEALRAATGMNFRQSANRCLVLITDAPFHQYGDGSGRTMYTARTMSTILTRADLRTFCIVTPTVEGYPMIAQTTGGQVFDIRQPFADILNRFVSTMTSLYTATYRSEADLIPDSIQVEVQLARGQVSRKSFAVLEVGRKLVVDDILFGSNRFTIDPSSTQALDYLIQLMKARKTLKLKIEGHTDDVGDHLYNMKLSNMRADAVRQYMVRKGIEQDRLFTIGYGETHPTASNDTDEGRRLNRRTEFIIVQK